MSTALPDRREVPGRNLFAALAGVVLVTVVGSRLPLPGIDPASIELLESSSPGALERVSILALWVMPYLAILSLAEFARLVFPAFARWEAESLRNRDSVRWFVRAATLALAAFQGYGIAYAILFTEVVADDAFAFVPMATISLVGGIALLVWLSERTSLPGFGQGPWLLLAIPMLGSLPLDIAAMWELVRSGAVAPFHAILALFVLLLAVGVIAFVALALLSDKDAPRSAAPARLDVLVWPPILAGTASGFVVTLLASSASSLGIIDSPFSLAIVYSLVPVVLVPLIVALYARRLVSVDEDGVARRPARRVLLAVAFVQLFVFLAGELLYQAFPTPFAVNGATLIVFVAVMLVLATGLARRHVERAIDWLEV